MACVLEPCQMNVSDATWSSTQHNTTVHHTMLLKHWRNVFGVFFFWNSYLPWSIKQMLFVTFYVQNCNFCPHFPQQCEELLPLNKFILLEFEFFRSRILLILLTVRFFSLAWSPLLVAIVLYYLFVWQLWLLELLLLHSGHQLYFSVCLHPLGAVIIKKHSLSLHLYADDIQIYLLLKSFSMIEVIVIEPSSTSLPSRTFSNLHSFTVTEFSEATLSLLPTHPQDWASLWSKCATWPFTN